MASPRETNSLTPYTKGYADFFFQLKLLPPYLPRSQKDNKQNCTSLLDWWQLISIACPQLGISIRRFSWHSKMFKSWKHIRWTRWPQFGNTSITGLRHLSWLCSGKLVFSQECSGLPQGSLAPQRTRPNDLSVSPISKCKYKIEGKPVQPSGFKPCNPWLFFYRQLWLFLLVLS